MKVYRFKLTCKGKVAWVEIDPRLVEDAMEGEFEAVARSISPLGMLDRAMRVESLGLEDIKV